MGTYIKRGRDGTNVVSTTIINIDNGAGTTIDQAILNLPFAARITQIYALYQTETAGTVAGANFKVGTTVGGAEICAATAYTNSATIGSKTSATLVSSVLPKNTSLFVRHTGIATTAAGEVRIVAEYEKL